MARYEIHQSDQNAPALREYLEAHGAQVDVIQRPLDWLVSKCGRTAVCEVKTVKGKLRPAQTRYLLLSRGCTAVLRTEADCDLLLKRLCQPHEKIIDVSCETSCSVRGV
jgi:hypothetical protein